MSGELRTVGRIISFSSILRYLGFLAFLAGIEEGIISGTIVVDFNVQLEFYLIFLMVFTILTAAILVKDTKQGVFLSSLLIVFYAFLETLSIPYYRLSLLFLLPLVLEVRNFGQKYGFRSRNGIWFISMAISLVAMLLLSGLIRVFPSTQSIGMLVASIADDVTPGGTPLLFVGGLVFFSRYVVFSISIQALILFTALSFILVENYFLIIRFVRENSRSVIGGQVSGALTVLSCQCESITAAFPSIVSLILSAAVLPLILESIVLVFLTNYLLRKRFMVGMRSNFLDRIYPVRNRFFLIIPASLLIIALPIMETFGVYLNWQDSLYFFGGMNFLMLIAGIFTAILLSFSKVLKTRFQGNAKPLALVAVSTAAMLVWFYPPLTSYTIENGSIFALMTLVSFLGGIMGGIAYIGSGGEGRRLFLEFLAMMFTMFTIVVFYISILSGYSIWPAFNLTEQVIFSIGVWILSLPFMWFATNIALNSSVGSKGANENET